MKTESRRRLRFGFMIMLCVFIICSVLTVFAACENKKDEEEADIPNTAYCKFEYEKDVYDINDVELTFYSGDTFLQRWWCQGQEFDPTQVEFANEEGTVEYQTEYEFLLDRYEKLQKYRPQYCDFYFTSFGEKYHIKRINEFEFKGESGYSAWQYSETLRIPPELFVNEYGTIYYSWEMTPPGDSNELAHFFRRSCCAYYKKDGDKIYISREDLKPEADYRDNEYAFYRIESLSDYLDVTLDNFEKDSEGDLTIKVYLGRTYPKEDSYDSAKLYFISENDGEKGKKLLKEIDYSNDNFLCDVLYDYNGRPSVVIYQHKEIISIPKEYVTGEERVGIVLYGQKDGVEIPISFDLFKYKYVLREFEGGKIYEKYYIDSLAPGVNGVISQEQFEEFLQGKKSE